MQEAECCLGDEKYMGFPSARWKGRFQNCDKCRDKSEQSPFRERDADICETAKAILPNICILMIIHDHAVYEKAPLDTTEALSSVVFSC